MEHDYATAPQTLVAVALTLADLMKLKKTFTGEVMVFGKPLLKVQAHYSLTRTLTLIRTNIMPGVLTDQNSHCQWPVDGPGNSCRSASESNPKMVVSGGTWTVGGTVKNTVARFSSRQQRMRLLGYDQRKNRLLSPCNNQVLPCVFPSGNGPLKIFDGFPNTLCAVELEQAKKSRLYLTQTG